MPVSAAKSKGFEMTHGNMLLGPNVRKKDSSNVGQSYVAKSKDDLLSVWPDILPARYDTNLEECNDEGALFRIFRSWSLREKQFGLVCFQHLNVLENKYDGVKVHVLAYLPDDQDFMVRISADYESEGLKLSQSALKVGTLLEFDKHLLMLGCKFAVSVGRIFLISKAPPGASLTRDCIGLLPFSYDKVTYGGLLIACGPLLRDRTLSNASARKYWDVNTFQWQ